MENKKLVQYVENELQYLKTFHQCQSQIMQAYNLFFCFKTIYSQLQAKESIQTIQRQQQQYITELKSQVGTLIQQKSISKYQISVLEQQIQKQNNNATLQLFETSLTLNMCLTIDPAKLQYIKMYGMPTDFIFDPILLNQFQ
jgi:IS30 family transposase